MIPSCLALGWHGLVYLDNRLIHGQPLVPKVPTIGWLHVGHESQIPRPGNYRRRTAAGRPLTFVRGGGQGRVLYKTCSHRGALVCRRDEGNAEVFQCFYQATVRDWSICLVALPVPLRYPDSESRLPEHRVKRYDLPPRPI